MSSRSPYTGHTRKLVLGIDIGTTHSGISYTFLDPGQIPEIRGVTRFPAQEHVGGDSKIPSVLLYDNSGQARAMGAETLQEQVIGQAEDEGWTRVEQFKLHLRPKGLETNPLTLPRNKSITGIYADFLRYLRSCAKTYIEQTHANGESLWNSMKNNVEYVITYPNGWEGAEQAHLRRAAVEAGLIHDTPSGQKLLQLLTEGEANLHFCVQNGLGDNIFRTGQGVIIVDAGRRTTNLSAFAPTTDDGYEEISVTQCYSQGSAFITRRAEMYLKEKFAGTRFADDVANMATLFGRTHLLRFRSADEPVYIKFGGVRDKDAALNIRAGILLLDGKDVASFFQPSIDAIVEGVLTQHKNSHKPISNVFLVGSLAASEFMFRTLQDAVKPFNMAVSRPHALVNRAVADGAVSFYLDRLVSNSLYVTQFDYGVCHSIDYAPNTMASRKKLIYRDAKGVFKVPGRFSIIIPKNTEVSGIESFSYSHCESAANAAALSQCSITIYRYHGKMDPCPEWLDMDQAQFQRHCQITGDLNSVPKLCLGPAYKPYYEVHYNVNITLNPSGEMSAYLTWDEDGVEKSGPAEVIYEAATDVGGK